MKNWLECLTGIGLIYINQNLVYTMGKVPGGGIIIAVFCISGQ